MRDGTDTAPKPMMMLGNRPLIWHVMRYYAFYGHRDFILCLGYGAQHIKDFFLHYEETSSNDFVMTASGQEIELLSSDIADWRISFIDTGLKSPIGERLRRVRHLLEGEELFLANYADVLTDAPLDRMVERMRDSQAGASLLAVPPQSAFHVVQMGENDVVTEIRSVNTLPMWENGGYFVLRQDVFDLLPKNGDLVEDGCAGLAAQGRLLAYPHLGYWHPADTVKERAALEESYQNGHCPWMVWDSEKNSVPVPEQVPVAIDIEAR